jgi:hypothetical protein
MNPFMSLSRLRLRAGLDHFAKIKDARQAWKVMHALREVLFPVVRGTRAGAVHHINSRLMRRSKWPP